MRIGLKMLMGCLILLGLSNCSIDDHFWKSGSGTVVEQKRELAEFSEIEASGAIEVNISQGDTQQVVVITDDNLQNIVKTKVEGKVLKVYSEGHLSNFSKLMVNIVVKNIEGIDLSGASKLYSKTPFILGTLKLNLSGASNSEIDVKAIEIKGELSGASNLKLKGAVGTFKIEASGASKCSAYDLTSANANISASGASRITLTCDNELNISASGASNVSYKGNAKIVKSQTSGASSISRD